MEVLRHSSDHDRRCRTAALWLLLLLLAGACVGRPTADQRGPWATAQRIAALDFGPDRIEQRTEHREMLQRWLSSAAARPRDWQELPAQLRDETLRTRTFVRDLKHGSAFELSRRPDHLPPLLPGSHELAQNLVESGDAVARFVWPEQPLGEIDDRRHRTHHEHDQAEATVLQRLLRRLRL